MTAQIESSQPNSRHIFDARKPIRSWNIEYFESWGFQKAKQAITEMNRQYEVTEMIHILLDTAGYIIPESSAPGSYESPLSPRSEDGRLLFIAKSIVRRKEPRSGRKQKPFDATDRLLFNTFNMELSPHNALHLLEEANEKDIEFIKARLRGQRTANHFGNQPILTRNDASTLRVDLRERIRIRFNIRNRFAALQTEEQRKIGNQTPN